MTKPSARKPRAHAVAVLPAPDAARLLAAALRAWSEQGDEELRDAAGRSWGFRAVAGPAPGLALWVDTSDARELATVSQATLGADELREAAVAGAIAHLAAKARGL